MRTHVPIASLFNLQAGSGVYSWSSTETFLHLNNKCEVYVTYVAAVQSTNDLLCQTECLREIEAFVGQKQCVYVNVYVQEKGSQLTNYSRLGLHELPSLPEDTIIFNGNIEEECQGVCPKRVPSSTRIVDLLSRV